MKIKYLTMLFCVFAFTHSYAQTVLLSGEEKDSKQFVRTPNFVDYEGIYAGGFSEGEYLLAITKAAAGKYIVQTKQNTLETKMVGGKTVGFSRIVFQKFEDCTLTNGKLTGAGIKGEFANSPEGKQGIIITVSGQGSDFCERSGTLTSTAGQDFWAGMYPEASFRLLSAEDLQSRSNEKLQITRNEIYARYQFIFTKGGKMEQYFKAEKWHTPLNVDVTKMLTSIEQANIKLIQKTEANNK